MSKSKSVGRAYKPYKWVVLKIEQAEKDVLYKILGGWSSGFARGDSWRCSSGVDYVKESEDESMWLVSNMSGSLYECDKSVEGMNIIMDDVFNIFREGASRAGIVVTLIKMEDYLSNKS